MHVVRIHVCVQYTVRGKILEGQNIGKCMLTNRLAVINWQIPPEYCLYRDGELGQGFFDGWGPGLVPPNYASIILSIISIIGSVWLKILL